MTIASAIATKQQQVADSYTAVSNKGGTLPATQNLTNLATAISSIPTGSSPTLITKSITANGTYNASSDNADGYSSVTVNVSGSFVGIPREIVNNTYRIPISISTFSLPSNATDLGENALAYAFFGCINLTSVDLSHLTTISGTSALAYTLHNCINLTSVDLSSVTTISGSSALAYVCSGCTNLTSVDLSSLTTISGNSAFSRAFYNARGLENMNFTSLTSIISGSSAFGYAFYDCTSLKTVSFPELEELSYNAFNYAFRNCTALTDVYFNSLKTTSFGSDVNQFNNMLNGTGTTVTHTIHFPSNLQSTISGLTGYPNFGGTSGYVTLSFDLPATS